MMDSKLFYKLFIYSVVKTQDKQHLLKGMRSRKVITKNLKRKTTFFKVKFVEVKENTRLLRSITGVIEID